MGIFSEIFGTQSKYSSDTKSLTREQIRVLVSRVRVRTLDSVEELLIEEAIDSARVSGKVSLRKIDEALLALVSKNKISINDKRGVQKQFVTFFEKQK